MESEDIENKICNFLNIKLKDIKFTKENSKIKYKNSIQECELQRNINIFLKKYIDEDYHNEKGIIKFL